MSIVTLRLGRLCGRWLLSSSVLVSGCAEPAPETDGWAELAGYDEPRVTATQQSLPVGAPSDGRAVDDRGAVLGFSSSSELVLFDSATGAVLAATGAAGGVSERDLAVDRRHARALVLETNAEGSASDIWSYPLVIGESGQHALGTRQHRASILAGGRIWPAPAGLVVFEPDDGPRWRLLRDDGEPVASVLAPLPLGAWAREHADGSELGALGLGADAEPGLVMARTWLSSEAMEDFELTPIRLGPAGPPSTARIAPLPDALRVSCEAERLVAPRAAAEAGETTWCAALDGLVLAGVSDGQLVVRVLADRFEPPAVVVPDEQPFGRVEQVLVLPGLGPRDELRLAVLGSQPNRLLVAAFVVRQDRIELDDRAGVTLRGRVRTQDRLFSRDLLAVGARRLLAATSVGVEAVRLRETRGLEGPTHGPARERLMLELDEHFEGSTLRGPLGGPVCRIE